MSISLLGAAEIREIAERLDLHPAKSLGQNFVVDANTCQKIVRLAVISHGDHVVEIGPGLGSLTLALLQATDKVRFSSSSLNCFGAIPIDYFRSCDGTN